MSEEKKKIEVVDGDGSTLNISPVYDHLRDVKPKSKENKKKIIVPSEKDTKQGNKK